MPVARAEGPSRRRLSVRKAIITIPISTVTTSSPIVERSLPWIQRPARWRKAKAASSESPSRTDDNQNVTQSERSFRPAQEEEPTQAIHPLKPEKVELRSSFTAAPDQAPNTHHRNQSLNHSFSKLVVASKGIARAPNHGPQTEPAADRTAPTHPFVPQLSKPKKKREGYGFSYSDTFSYDSDEYPDTECEWDRDEQKTQPNTRLLTSNEQRQEWTTAEHTVQHSFESSATTVQDQSFNDVVVMRDVGSFHIAKPQRSLSCTQATRDDTIRLKGQAKALFNSYQESGDVQAKLLSRLERMVHAKQQQAPCGQAHVLSVTHCALKLRDFLLKIKDSRIETGEHQRFVEHEIEWVKWIVEASRTGVMHLKTPGCKCRPHWEED